MQNINEQLDTAINSRDLRAIRNILTTSMVQDPGWVQGVFDERLRRCVSRGIGESDIFEPFEGEPIVTDESLWTKDYYAGARTELRYNFSCKRKEHLRNVGQKLYPHVQLPVSPSPKPGYTGDWEKTSSGGSGGTGGTSGGDSDVPGCFIPAVIGAALLVLFWLLFTKR
jgi:hypothetical protein